MNKHYKTQIELREKLFEKINSYILNTFPQYSNPPYSKLSPILRDSWYYIEDKKFHLGIGLEWKNIIKTTEPLQINWEKIKFNCFFCLTYIENHFETELINIYIYKTKSSLS